MTNWAIISRFVHARYNLKNLVKPNNWEGKFGKDGEFHDTLVKQGSEYVSNDRMENE